MKKKIIKAIEFTDFLLLGVFLLYLAFRDVDVKDVMVKIREANYRWIALSVVFATLTLVFRTFRWRLLMEPLDAHPSKINIFSAINVGYLANFLFPRIGEVTRCGVLNRTDGLPVDSVFGTVVVERIFDLLMAILMLCILLLLRFGDVVTYIENHGDFKIEDLEEVEHAVAGFETGWILLSAITVLTLVLIVLYITSRKRSTATININIKDMFINIVRKLKEALNRIGTGIKSVKRLRSFKMFMAYNFLIYGMYLLQTYVLFFALDSTGECGIIDALFVLVLSAVALTLPVQGGLGTYHTIVPSGFILFGLTFKDGLVYATIAHSSTAILYIFLGAVSMVFVYIRKKPKTQ